MKIHDRRPLSGPGQAKAATRGSGASGVFRALLEKEVAPADDPAEVAAGADIPSAAIGLAFEAADLLDTALRRLADNQAADADLLERLGRLRSELGRLHIEDFDDMNTLIAVESERLRLME